MTSARMFESASKVVITGGSFIGAQSNVGAVGVKPDASTMLVCDTVSWNAILNSGGRADTVRCYPGTREAVMGQIESWISGEDNSGRPIFWLSGPAGAGKSAIAQSIAERCLALGVPMANFFFFRADRTRNHAAPLAATLLVQLFDICPAVKWRLDDFITQNPYILNRSVEQQLKTLMISALIHPGQVWTGRQKTVLILDGLDECSSDSTQQDIIRALHHIVTRPDSPFILLVSSRAEPHLTRSFNTVQSQVTHLYIDGDKFSPSNDIRRFVAGEFNEIKKTHHLAWTLDADWPSLDDIESIVRKSSGHFIYASTIMRFLQTSPDSPILSLDMVKGIRPVENNSPFAQLDAIYAFILAKARNWSKTADILAAQVLPDALFVGTLPAASWKGTKPRNSYMLDSLGYSTIEISSYTSDLTSLIKVRSGAVTFYHASLSDFLLDKRRAGNFFIDLDRFRLKLVPALFHYASATTSHVSWSLVAQHFARLKTTNDAMTEVLSSSPLLSGGLAFNGTTLRAFLVKIKELYLGTDIELYKLMLKKWLTWFHTNHGTLRDGQLDAIQHADGMWKDLTLAVVVSSEATKTEDGASTPTESRNADKDRHQTDAPSKLNPYIDPRDAHTPVRNPHRKAYSPRDLQPPTSRRPPPRPPCQPDDRDHNPSLSRPLPPRSISPPTCPSSVASYDALTTISFDQLFEPEERWKAALKFRIDKEAESMFAEVRKVFDVKMRAAITHADARDLEDDYIQTVASLQQAVDDQYEIELQDERECRLQVYLATVTTLPERAPETVIKKDRNLSFGSDDEPQAERHAITRQSKSFSDSPASILHEGLQLTSGRYVPAAIDDYALQTRSSSVCPESHPSDAQRSLAKQEEVRNLSHRQQPRLSGVFSDEQVSRQPRSRQLATGDPAAPPMYYGLWDSSLGESSGESISSDSECHSVRSSCSKGLSPPPNDFVPPTKAFTQSNRRGSTASMRSTGSGASVCPVTEIIPEHIDDFSGGHDGQGCGDSQGRETSPERSSEGEDTAKENGATGKKNALERKAEEMRKFARLAQQEQEKLCTLIASAEELERLLAIREADVKERERSLEIREAKVQEREQSLAIREVKVKEREETAQKLPVKPQEREAESRRLGEEEATQQIRKQEGEAEVDSEVHAAGCMEAELREMAKASEERTICRARERARLRYEKQRQEAERREESARREAQAAEENARRASEANAGDAGDIITEEDLNDPEFVQRQAFILQQVKYEQRAEDILRLRWTRIAMSGEVDDEWA